jgi:hypothetical protein
MMFPVPRTMTLATYNPEQAKLEYPKPWIHRREAVDLCKKFGVSEYKWREVSASIPKHPNIKGLGLYNRDALIAVLQG